ncbi:WD40-repeat-containing domain protein [Coprinopsis sp. MPI-PUGE-AT-0042]|nr:WD40-repeat-containing domain protein [Coprinopsis sp. MPI-PUGE-AT-0042]
MSLMTAAKSLCAVFLNVRVKKGEFARGVRASYKIDLLDTLLSLITPSLDPVLSVEIGEDTSEVVGVSFDSIGLRGHPASLGNITLEPTPHLGREHIRDPIQIAQWTRNLDASIDSLASADTYREKFQAADSISQDEISWLVKECLHVVLHIQALSTQRRQFWIFSGPAPPSSSADHCFSITGLTTGQKVRRIRAHREIIHDLDRTISSVSGNELVATASDDGTVMIWEGGEEASKEPMASLNVGCPATAICWNADGSQIYVGAVDNEVHFYDLRKQEQVYSLGGDTDKPTSLAPSPDGNFLLAPSLSS